MDEVDDRIENVMNALRQELASIRSGRASPSLIENVSIDAYESKMLLKELGAIAAPDARMLTVEVWDSGQVEAVRKGLQEANLGLNPHVEGQLIRLPLPPLSQERREQLVKLVRQKIEAARVSVRQIRSEAKRTFTGKMSEDLQNRMEKRLQEKVDEAMEDIRRIGERKVQELREFSP